MKAGKLDGQQYRNRRAAHGNAGDRAAPGLEEHLTSQLLEELNDVIYVSDPKTYELLFINRTIKEDLNIIDDYIGKKCYKVLQGRDTPCPFCTNDKLKFNEYYVWEHTNELMNRDFIVKDKLIQWQGRTARMEFAMDIAEHNHLSKGTVIAAGARQRAA